MDDRCAEALDRAIKQGIDEWFIVIEEDVEEIDGEGAFVWPEVLEPSVGVHVLAKRPELDVHEELSFGIDETFGYVVGQEPVCGIRTHQLGLRRRRVQQ